MAKKTLVLGASLKEERYSNQAVKRLIKHGFEAIPVGLREGKIEGQKILIGRPKLEDIHTVTLYISEKHQDGLFAYIKTLNPERVIFNPGTENLALFQQLKKHNIECLNACTLVMLSVGNY